MARAGDGFPHGVPFARLFGLRAPVYDEERVLLESADRAMSAATAIRSSLGLLGGPPMDDDPLGSLLARGPIGPCELDILLFLHRHPSLYMPPDQLCSRIGYRQAEVENGLRTLAGAGLIVQRRGSSGSAVLYRWAADVAAPWFDGVARMVSTVEGRRRVRDVIRWRALDRPTSRDTRETVPSRQRQATLEITDTLLSQARARRAEMRRLVAELARLVRRQPPESDNAGRD